MTCIAGIILDGEVWIGGDSCTSERDTFYARKDPKIFRHSGMLIGFAGNFRVGQIVKYCVPEIETAIASPDAIIQNWIPAVRAALNEHGGRDDNGAAGEFCGALLVAIPGRLFELGGDFALHELPNYGAVGTGENTANGALFAAWEHFKTLGGYNIVQMALRAASAHISSVCPPFHIEKL